MYPSRTSESAAPMYLFVLVGGGVGVDTWVPSRTPDSAVYFYPRGEGWCCDQFPLAHPRRCPGFHYARESELTPWIPNQMSSVVSPSIDSCISLHYLCCDRNTAARPIQIEEKFLSMNYFIVRRKEIYSRPHVIIGSITMPIAAPNGGVTSLSLDYP